MASNEEKFLSMIVDKASAANKHIVLPEGDDPRTIEAIKVVAEKNIAKLTVLGNAAEIKKQLDAASVNMANITIISPCDSDKLAEYATAFFEMRKHKGVDLEKATAMVSNVMYYATMMVQLGDADGMVAGAAHSSADTIRPALQIIKSAKGISTVSSMFFMAKEDQTYLFSDCGLNQEPNPAQLADIALSTAKTAQQFGFTPKVAMLCYSTYGSAKSPVVDKMSEATKLAKEKLSSEMTGEYAIDGEMQFDAAFVPAIASSKCPDSPLKGEANTFIFPDLCAGNICYKAVERIGGYNAYGPILQGIAKPVNDLSRGCSSDDIVATVAITAIQAC